MAPKYKAFIVALIAGLGGDQLSKMWARASLRPIYPDVKTVIPNFWDFRYSENPGSAFSMFHNVPGARYLLLVIGIAALGLVGVWLKKAPDKSARLGAWLGLLAGGALGNIIDRVVYGRVTDFIVWHWYTHEWPTFNIADAVLVAGVVGMFLDMRDPPPAKTAKSK